MSSDAVEKSEEPSKCWKWFTWLAWTIWFTLTLLMLVYISLAFLFIYSTQLKMEILFANRVNLDFYKNLSACEDFGLKKCELVTIDGTAGNINAWFIPPTQNKYTTKEAFILYLHGNTGSRGAAHRVRFYKRLTRLGYHILAIDYRGYADSPGIPTEQGLVEDAKSAYKWLRERSSGSACYVWGHSMGSAVGIQLAAWLNMEREQLNGMILEAPFNNYTDAILANPIATPFKAVVPDLENYLEDVHNVFLSNHWLTKVTSPVLIFHDVSDIIVNVNLGRKLYLSVKNIATTNVRMMEFDEQLYHKDVTASKKLKPFLRDFIVNTS